ncbi:uncharacterized protein si:dkeyp-117h8.4 isoform X1 [Xyrichtys novacula]|uniref:Uncharacterized protein si:dkeyp-117h8.4 isoform X1 n=1 Tax=Xyrichtys novacula TaxID=13765 RepID=A0AAV1FF47_XYRNO|nr:uncharacterized protein si:dkeyp-117h8.4 isoform X1 [Xyrichtys novacula]
MSVDFEENLSQIELIYRNSLARIIEKYSGFSKQNYGPEVDLENIQEDALEYCMEASKKEMDKFESQRLAELREDSSATAQDASTDSQLDCTSQSDEADGSCSSSVASFIGEVSAAGTSRSALTQLTVSSLDESQRTFSDIEQQPEDQDEGLKMILSRNSCLGELYPTMICRLKSAVQRQHVSEVASSVLRRYRRWRQSNNSLNVSGLLVSYHKQIPKNRSNKENSGSAVKRSFIGTEGSHCSHLQITNQQERQHSPGRGRNLQRRQQHKPILVMDFSGSSDTSMEESPPSPIVITSSDESQRDQQPPAYTVRSSQSPYSSPKATLELSLRSKRLFNASHSQQTDTCTSQSMAAKEGRDSYGSPVRQSPYKSRIMSSLSRSPLSFSRSPKVNPVEVSREMARPRPESPCFPQLRSLLLHRNLSPQASRPPPPCSASAAESCHRLRRHLSFDSPLVSQSHSSYSPQKVDEEFTRIYHKYVCQNKSPLFKGLPCRFCARNCEARRDHSSLALDALALSPHRSVLRKRHRELSLESVPRSKRFREEYCMSSPWSSHYRTVMLRRRLCPSEPKQLCDDPSKLSPSKLSPSKLSPSKISPSKLSPKNLNLFQSLNPQQQPAEHCQTWLSRNRSQSAAEFPGHGRSRVRNAATGSPQKRR